MLPVDGKKERPTGKQEKLKEVYKPAVAQPVKKTISDEHEVKKQPIPNFDQGAQMKNDQWPKVEKSAISDLKK